MTDILDGNNYKVHKLLVANRGEIALRILRTAKDLCVRTVSIYSRVDATSPHVLFADEAVALQNDKDGDEEGSNAKAYLDIEAIIDICVARGVTLVHPGYGFLSENASFAHCLAKNGIQLLGPDATTIEEMGLKHRARAVATRAQVPIIPGSDRLVTDVEDGESIAKRIGYPVMLKATAGGGGIGLVVCWNSEELMLRLPAIQERAQGLFRNGGVFVEKFFHKARHIEVQIFGNGSGHVIHIGERECSVQRRHQKIIEEAPSPYLIERPELRGRMCDAAIRLGKLMNYKSAGTVEFLVDDASGQFFFLEMNTRLQVEHGVTEQLYPGLDIVGLMIVQGVYEHPLTRRQDGVPGLSERMLVQAQYALPVRGLHVLEARVYCENPVNNFAPTAGLVQLVQFPIDVPRVRVDSWLKTGTTVTPHYDALIAKVIVWDSSRLAAIAKLKQILAPDELDAGDANDTTRVRILGPPTNIPFLFHVLHEQVFSEGNSTTEWIDERGVEFIPSAFTVVSPGVDTTVQSLPTRNTGLGVPPSGPMDPLSFQAGNILVGNALECEGLEFIIPPGSSGSSSASFTALFHTTAAIAVTGAPAAILLDGREYSNWTRIYVPMGAKLTITSPENREGILGGGLRAYLLVAGGFPGVPSYLGSKSTSLGIGGYQGRALQVGDLLHLHPRSDRNSMYVPPIPRTYIAIYPSHWTLLSLPGPHDDTEFLTTSGIESFYARKWEVATASNRMGIRLKPVDITVTGPVLDWARKDGGEGGSHPSNILDNGYARGSINLNGDTPVILTNEGPSMGGYLCVATIATADQWKLGQLRPGDTVQFQRISMKDALSLEQHCENWLDTLLALSSGFNASPVDLMNFVPSERYTPDPKLHVMPATVTRPRVVFRQAGDSAILVEYGSMTLDLFVRARIHAFETAIRSRQVSGITELAPCIRSTMVHFDNDVTSQDQVLADLIVTENSLPEAFENMSFFGLRLTLPIVLDDKWSREALTRYMLSTRDKAAYLPSNIEYLANNNGISGGSEEALRLLVSSPWLVLGTGFYLACPFLIPIDPRCRLIGQKMNPSRLYTPSGAVGIAGLVAAIYPVESPGGYQLFGRSLPTWRTWGMGPKFNDQPWALKPFDEVVFEPVSEEKYSQILSQFEGGLYQFKTESIRFDMKDYRNMISSMKDEIANFKRRQRDGVEREEARESVLLKEWQEREESEAPPEVTDGVEEETPFFLSASLSGTLWQIKVKPGDIVKSEDQAIVVLEAMKTEIVITAGARNIGHQVAGFGKGVREGKIVRAGDKLVFFTKV